MKIYNVFHNCLVRFISNSQINKYEKVETKVVHHIKKKQQNPETLKSAQAHGLDYDQEQRVQANASINSLCFCRR